MIFDSTGRGGRRQALGSQHAPAVMFPLKSFVCSDIKTKRNAIYHIITSD